MFTGSLEKKLIRFFLFFGFCLCFLYFLVWSLEQTGNRYTKEELVIYQKIEEELKELSRGDIILLKDTQAFLVCRNFRGVEFVLMPQNCSGYSKYYLSFFSKKGIKKVIKKEDLYYSEYAALFLKGEKILE